MADKRKLQGRTSSWLSLDVFWLAKISSHFLFSFCLFNPRWNWPLPKESTRRCRDIWRYLAKGNWKSYKSNREVRTGHDWDAILSTLGSHLDSLDDNNRWRILLGSQCVKRESKRKIWSRPQEGDQETTGLAKSSFMFVLSFVITPYNPRIIPSSVCRQFEI